MNVQKEYILKCAAEGKRIDGRGMEDFRPINIQKTPLQKAEGSSRVRIGSTEVMVGVKLGIGTPFPDKPDEGVLIVSAELSPLAHPDFEMGPPREKAIELARVVDRGIRESGAIDTKKLCITPGEKAWTVFLDIQIINHNGNLIDAYSLASAVALTNAKIPDFDGEKINYKKRTEPLPVTKTPIAITVCKLRDGVLCIDPTIEEENAAVSHITVTTAESGNVVALQKGGAPLSLEEIEQAMTLSVKKGKELRALL